MANQLQILRSSTAAARPTAGTRQPGEIYVNFADGVFGFIDAAQNPVDVGWTTSVVTNPAAADPQRIDAAAVGHTPLNIRGFAGQTAALFRIETDGGQTLFRVQGSDATDISEITSLRLLRRSAGTTSALLQFDIPGVNDSWQVISDIATQTLQIQWRAAADPNYSERVRFQQDGMIKPTKGIYAGTVNPAFASARGFYLSDETTYGFFTSQAGSGAAAGQICWVHYYGTNQRLILTAQGDLSTRTGVVGTVPSSAALKQDVTDAGPQLEELLRLPVRKFSFIDEGDNGVRQIGFIVEEVKPIKPGLILQMTDGDKVMEGIKTSILIPILVKALQELTAEVRGRLDALEAA